MEILCHRGQRSGAAASAEGCVFQAFRGWSGSVGEQERSPVRSARRNRIGPSYGNYVALSWKISKARLVPDRLWKFVALYGKKVSINHSLWKFVVLYGNL